MDTIVRLIGDGSTAVFDPGDIKAMAMALEDVCKSLNIDGDVTAREVVAVRIIELARRGERSPAKLRDRVLAEANGGTGR
jgi:hypothetical protein